MQLPDISDKKKSLEVLNHELNHNLRADWSRIAGLMEIVKSEGFTPQIAQMIQEEVRKMDEHLQEMQKVIDRCQTQ